MYKKVYAEPDMTLTKVEEILSIPASMLINTGEQEEPVSAICNC
jgi:hypothetical protein